MSKSYDIAIVGAGICGCSIARQLSRYTKSIVVIEAQNDVSLGASKANGGMVHAGYDPAPDTQKAAVNARGCALYSQWAEELNFGFERSGSMVMAFGPEEEEHLKKLLAQGKANGVPELTIIGPEEILQHESRANPEATAALWCPSTGHVDPFEVTLAAIENAVANGADFMRSAPVEAIERAGDEYIISTPQGEIRAGLIINAAGSGAADISRMAGAESFEMVWRQGNIVVLDKESVPYTALYPVPTPISKGVIITGTVHGNTIITATAAIREPGDKDTYSADVEALLTGARKLAPSLDTRRVVRTFGGGRAVIKDRNDFFIAPSAKVPNFVQVAGIQSPGVASAPAIAELVDSILHTMGVSLEQKRDYNPVRPKPDDFDLSSLEHKNKLIAQDRTWGKIVCRCETVPEAEIVAAIHRNPGALSVEGVKRRCRAGMGRCQSGFCQSRVVEILARELGVSPAEILLEDEGSQIVSGPVKGAM